jgi:hypothetical protein
MTRAWYKTPPIVDSYISSNQSITSTSTGYHMLCGCCNVVGRERKGPKP